MLHKGVPRNLTSIQHDIQDLDGCVTFAILDMMIMSERLRCEEILNNTTSFQVLNADELKKQSSEGELHYHVILTYVDRTITVDESYLENLRARRKAFEQTEARLAATVASQ